MDSKNIKNKLDIDNKLDQYRHTTEYKQIQGNVRDISMSVRSELIVSGIKTVMENPAKAPIAATEGVLGWALITKESHKAITNCIVTAKDEDNRRRHIESYKRPETPTRGDMQTPN